MKTNVIEEIIEIYKKRRVNMGYLQEYYPSLIKDAEHAYGSLKNAVEVAGIDYNNFISGFDIETSLNFNTEFITLTIHLFEKIRIFLDRQYLITFGKFELDPIRVDLEHSIWYIIKILPWSNYTQKLIPSIYQFNPRKIIIVYLKKAELPKVELVRFNHIEKYLNRISGEDPLIRKLKILKGALNVIKFEL